MWRLPSRNVRRTDRHQVEHSMRRTRHSSRSCGHGSPAAFNGPLLAGCGRQDDAWGVGHLVGKVAYVSCLRQVTERHEVVVGAAGWNSRSRRHSRRRPKRLSSDRLAGCSMLTPWCARREHCDRRISRRPVGPSESPAQWKNCRAVDSGGDDCLPGLSTRSRLGNRRVHQL